MSRVVVEVRVALVRILRWNETLYSVPWFVVCEKFEKVLIIII